MLEYPCCLCFYDFSAWFLTCFDSVVFLNCFDSVVVLNCFDSVVVLNCFDSVVVFVFHFIIGFRPSGSSSVFRGYLFNNIIYQY